MNITNRFWATAIERRLHSARIGVLAALLTVGAAASVNAEDSNRSEVRANLERDGWLVIWGKNFTEADWGRGAQAIAESVAAENPGPFLRWFANVLNENFSKIESNLAGVSRRDIEQWILQSLQAKRIVVRQGLQIEAGFATYNRWQREVHHEPRVRWKGLESTVEMVKVENKIPLPNWNQFYIRYRFTGGGRPQPPIAVGASIGGIVLNNNYSGTVTIRLYHSDAPSRVFANWTFQPRQRSYMDMNQQRVVLGGQWRIQIEFGNGVKSPIRFIRDVGAFHNGAWNVDASRIFSG